jgi:hypothetical protein
MFFKKQKHPCLRESSRWQIFHAIYAELGVSRRVLFVAYSVIPLLIFVSAPFLWPVKSYIRPVPVEERALISVTNDAATDRKPTTSEETHGSITHRLAYLGKETERRM